MSKKLFTKVVSLSLTAAMVLSMAPVNASAAKEVKPKSMKASKSSKIKVGQTKTITASRKSKKSTNDVKYVNFKPAKTKNIGIGVKTSDDTIVSVEKVSNGKYTYTGVTTGTATLTITSRAKTAKGKKLQAKLDVTVINPFRVTQTGSHTFTMSTADKLEKVEAKDIKVVQEGSNIDNAVKEVKLSEDKMSVEVTMHVPFVDQKKYEVTFGKEKDSFVASVGKPAAINVKTQTVVANKATKVEFAVLDEKGIDVTKTLDESKITISVSTSNGFYDTKENKLTIYRVGGTAEAKVVYHTWTYDQKTGKEIVVEGKGTITAVDKSAITVTGIDKYTIAKTVLSWDTDEMFTTMPRNQSKGIFVRMKKSDGTYVDNLGKEKANFQFSATNSPVVSVGPGNNIYGLRTGSAYVTVVYTDFNIKYEYTLPVTVGEDAMPSSIMVSPNYVTVNKGTMVDTPVIAQIKDQYGEPVDHTGADIKATHLSGAKLATITALGASVRSDSYRLGVKASETGVGMYKITYRRGNLELHTTLTVNCIEVGKNVESNYMLKPVDISELDTTITENSLESDIEDLLKGITFEIYETKGNVIVGKAGTEWLKHQTVANDDRVSSISVYKRGLSEARSDRANTANFDVDTAVLEMNSVDTFTVYPVIRKGNDVLLTQPSGKHTVTVQFYVPDDNNPGKYKKVILTSDYTITNGTKDGILGENYKLLEGDKKAVINPYNAFEFAGAVVQNLTAGYRLADSFWTRDYFYLASSGEGAWYNRNSHSSVYNKPGVPMVTGNKYHLDTAPIPTFKTAKDTIQVWTLKDKLASNVEIAAAEASFAVTNKSAADVNVELLKDSTTAYDLMADVANNKNAVYYRVFNDKATADTAIASLTSTSNLATDVTWTKMNDNPTAMTKATTLGKYIVFALTKIDDTKANYVSILTKGEVKLNIDKVTLNANAGTAPATDEAYDGIQVGNVALTADPVGGTGANPTAVKYYDGTTEKTAGKWNAGETPKLVFTIAPEAGYKFTPVTKVALDDSGNIKSADYTISVNILDDGKLEVTLTKKEALKKLKITAATIDVTTAPAIANNIQTVGAVTLAGADGAKLNSVLNWKVDIADDGNFVPVANDTTNFGAHKIQILVTLSPIAAQNYEIDSTFTLTLGDAQLTNASYTITKGTDSANWIIESKAALS